MTCALVAAACCCLRADVVVVQQNMLHTLANFKTSKTTKTRKNSAGIFAISWNSQKNSAKRTAQQISANQETCVPALSCVGVLPFFFGCSFSECWSNRNHLLCRMPLVIGFAQKSHSWDLLTYLEFVEFEMAVLENYWASVRRRLLQIAIAWNCLAINSLVAQTIYIKFWIIVSWFSKNIIASLSTYAKQNFPK